MKNKKGFTIVELVIVIAVIAILAAVLIPTFTTVTANARASAALQQAKSSMESLLSNTEGQMSKGSLFAVTNQKSYEANYWFTFADGAIAAKSEKEMGTVGGEGNLWPVAKEADEGNDYYRVFVTAKAYQAVSEDDYSVTAASNVTKLLKSVLDKCTDKEGVVALGSFDLVSGYATGTYTVGEGESAEVIDLWIYTSGDLADTCIAIIQ